MIDPNELGPLPGGFRFAGVHAGIKRSRPDLAVIACIPGTTAAGCFTKNPVRAACVDRDAALLPGSDVRALVVNSGNANAMTGAAGVEANDAMAAAVAEALGVAPAAVLSCSTGVIGVPLFVPTIARAVPRLCQRLADDAAAVADFADAILTTDTTRKLAAATVERPGSPIPIRIVGVAKGSGMIHPDMATTLGFVCTDARVSPALLARLLSSGVDDTFNAISVDGDTSTNDAVIALASGASGHLVESVDEVEAFAAAFHRVLDELARMVAADGEGATRLLSVTVQGAPDRAAARVLARGICTGSLFKCSVFAGEPAGWGRACAALGQAALEHGVPLDPAALAVSAQGIAVVAGGAGIENVPLGELSRRLREPQVAWTVRVGDGPGRFTAHGCDLSYDYVRINADEALQVEVRPDGAVGRNLSLSSYTPTLKHQLIFDALDYVHRFAGMRLVIGASGAVVEKPELLASLARDLELLAAAGLRPLVVVGAAATAQALVEHFEQSPHRLALVPPDPAAIARKLDRAHPCVLVQTRPDPGELVALAIRLGAGKLLALADDQGLHDETGLCAQLGPEQAIAGLDRGRFSTGADEFLALARHAARQGLPALHLVDGRVPHALVAELFTEQGVGTLVTRQALVNGSHS